MFNGVKNQFLAKIQVEKFLSSQYVKLIDEINDMLINQDLTKGEIADRLMIIRAEITKKYNLSEKDIYNEKQD